MHDQPDDEPLVDRARRGDERAWEDLYRAVAPRLRRYLARRVGPDHADDSLSETMARAVRGFDGFEPGPAGFDGWVFGIARRVAADHHRRADRQRREVAAGCKVAAPVAGDGDPGEALELADDRHAVRTSFTSLAPPERELLRMRLVAGMSADDVGTALGKRPGAVRTAQSRAVARLRRLVDQSGAGRPHRRSHGHGQVGHRPDRRGG